MLKTKLKFTLRAHRDLDVIEQYTSQNFGPAQAAEYLLELKSGLQTLRQHPQIGYNIVVKNQSLQSYQINHHRIFYQTDDEAIIVIGILHVSQLPSIHFKSLFE